ncbi:XRE family transcriptional regulator [Streptomyces sp. NBC_01166]|uniref:helix-turn-helix domain-containing protein n=1 Tax=Streptomyces sp. NBC_01166 TaxID=2903755 RepID=UPI0038691197|nr:XRE family transcriptional regulator [Streptomyces sp. NBC_01166]
MPRWKALPEELDSQVREFTGQLRGLVDRSGLSLAAVADRTGYSKTSWERYLNGRLLAPKGAVVALAEVTGVQQHHLTTMWEPAELAWSRSEMRHDMTMEAIRISQARAAPGEAGVAAAPVAGRRADGATGVPTAPGPGGEGCDSGRPPSVPVQRGTVPRIPQQPQPGAVPDPTGGGHHPVGGPGGRREGGRSRLPLFLAGLVGALLLMAGAVLLTDLGGDQDTGTAAATPSAEPGTSAPQLPAGVECRHADCTGQDPEAMGCGGQFASTVARETVGGGLVEVRYSETCGAAWARITRASPGDTVKIAAGPSEQDGTVDAGSEAYTPMVAVKKASDAKACATLASGTTGCTTPE